MPKKKGRVNKILSSQTVLSGDPLVHLKSDPTLEDKISVNLIFILFLC